MALNVITAQFNGGTTANTELRWQRSYGQVLHIEGLNLPEYFEVDFAVNSYEPTTTQLGHNGDVIIPSACLDDGADITAYIFLHEGDDDGETVYVIHIAVVARPPREDPQPTPAQQDIISEAILALNDAIERTSQDVEDADADALKSEGYAVGTQDGVPVEEGSPYYRHNADYLQHKAGEFALSAEGSASNAEAWAAGAINGYPVTQDYPQYENNAKFYAGKADQSAQDADQSKRDAEASKDAILNLMAEAEVNETVGVPEVDVTVREEEGHKVMDFTFRNLKGEQGDRGEPFRGTFSVDQSTGYLIMTIIGED